MARSEAGNAEAEVALSVQFAPIWTSQVLGDEEDGGGEDGGGENGDGEDGGGEDGVGEHGVGKDGGEEEGDMVKMVARKMITMVPLVNRRGNRKDSEHWK